MPEIYDEKELVDLWQ